MTNSNLSQTMSAQQILDREFLQLRAKILELAASFDRLNRAPGAADQARIALLQRGLSIVLDDRPDRAEQLQLLFSREYNSNWKSEFGIDS